MDIIQDQKLNRKKQGLGLEKLSLVKVIEDSENVELPSTIIDGDIVTMAEDLAVLPEADYDDPNIAVMLAEDNELILKKYGRLTSEEVESIILEQKSN